MRKTLTLASSVLLATTLLVPATAAAAPDDHRPERDAWAATHVSPDDMPLGEGEEAREYFVRLAGTPAALHTESEPGRPAASRMAPDGTVDYQAGSAGARAYETELQREQLEVAEDGARETVGRELDVLASYTVANHGFGTVMTPTEARALADHPDVVWVQEFPEYFPTTDRGPAFVGARSGVTDREGVWERPETGPAAGATGEGVVVGVIDTGINPSSPSFQATTDDGYTHTNPRDRYYGSCDPDNDGTPIADDESIFGGLPADAAAYDPDLAALCNDKLIGMWGYHSVTGTFDQDTGELIEPGTPIDYDGHGSHTAGTAAGGFADGVSANVGDEVVPGNSFDVSGVAPHANIISYGACCTGLALLSSIDQMIVDDVDVLNFSIGSTSPTADLLQDGITFGFLVARLSGIHVANSAGNSGPGAGTIGSPSDAPWVTSVASSTHDRLALNAVTGLPDDVFDGGTIEGKGVSAPLETPTELVYAGDLEDADDNPLCLADVWDEGDLDGLVVVCDRGETGRVEKSEVAAAAGAVGFVLANDQANAGSIQGSLNGDSFPIPGVHITYDDGVALKGWLETADAPTVTITGTSFDVADRWGDTVSIFSSRGPNGFDANLLSPQVTAPGTDVLAPYGSDDSTEYQFISGTSMSGPHVAGAFALLVDIFDDELTAAEAQSALQLTARRDVLDTDGVTPAGPFDVGSGHIDVAAAAATGLVMDVDVFDFLDTFDLGLDTTALNLASMGQSQCVGTCTWERTVTGAPGADELSYTVAADAEGFDLTVEPSAFTISEGEDVTITVTADVEGATYGEFLFGAVELTTDAAGVSDGHLPVVVQPSPFAGPEWLEIVSEGYVDAISVEYTAADASGLTVDLDGLAPAELDELVVAQDPTPLSPFVDFDESAVVWLEVGEDASRLVAHIGETTSPDIDLFVGRDVEGDGTIQAAETLCVSAAGGSDEACDLFEPEPGSYWVLVQNWESSAAGEDATELLTAVVAGDEGNVEVDAPTSVEPGDSFELDLSWMLEPPVRHWFGVVALGSTDETPGEYLVPIDLVVEPEAPVADAGGPYQVVLGENLTLDGSGSGHPEDVTIDAFEWDVSELGIASPQAGESLTVRPTVAGERTVTLTVTADGITDTDTAVVEVLTEAPTPPTPPRACDAIDPVSFPDVSGGPHGANIGCVAGFGIALGGTDGTFGPLGDVRRDQMASFLTRMLQVSGVELPTAPERTFPDVTGGPHALAIAQLADLGIVEGRTDGRYDPFASVTRAQMASFLIRSLEVSLDRDLTPSAAGPFTDIAGSPHADNIRVANELGIAQGRTATTYAPGDDVRRDQMGSFIARSLQVLQDEGVELTPLR